MNDDVIVMVNAKGFFARCTMCSFQGHVFEHRYLAEADRLLHLHASHGAVPMDMERL